MMPTTTKLWTLAAILLSLVFGRTTDATAQVTVRLELLPDNVTYRVSFLPNTTWNAPQHLTSTAQITLRVPHAGFLIGNLQSLAGNWAHNSTIEAPVESPGFDYFSFGLVGATGDIAYQTGEEITVFTFENTGNCPGAVRLMETTDPFAPPNSQSANVGCQLTTFGAGIGVNAITAVENVGSVNCNTTPGGGGCLIKFDLDLIGGGKYRVSMTPDTTWAAPFNTVASAQITVKTPPSADGFSVGKFQNLIADVVFQDNGFYPKPAEEPTSDYHTFGLVSVGTALISFKKGVKTALFEFENTGTCSGGTVRLMDETDPFLPPNSQNANVGNQLTVFGWGTADAPICLGPSVSAPCVPIPRDTVSVVLTAASDTFCIQNFLQIPGGAGQGSVCSTGSLVAATFPTGASSCVQLTTAAFSGFDTLCTVHCSGGLCDTTVFFVEIDIAPPCLVAIDSVLKKDPTGCGRLDGQLTIAASGAADLLFCLDGNCQTSPVFDSLGAGIFQVQIKKAGQPDCFSPLQSVALADPSPPEIQQVLSENPTHCDSTDGKLTISATNGWPIGSLLFSVDNGASFQPSPVFAGQGGGLFNIFVKNDSTGCTASFAQNPVVLSQPANCCPVLAVAVRDTFFSCEISASYCLETAPGIDPAAILFWVNNLSVAAADSCGQSGRAIPLSGFGLKNILLLDPSSGCADTLQIWRPSCGQTDTVRIDAGTGNGGPFVFCGQGSAAASNWTYCSLPVAGQVSALPGSCFQYEPGPDFNGADTFCLLICNDVGLCDTLNVVVFSGQNIAVPVANNDSLHIAFGNEAELFFLQNDLFSGNYTVNFIQQPQVGTVTGGPPTWRYTYHFPPNGQCSEGLFDVFQYSVCNEYGCDSAFIMLYVECDPTRVEVYNGFSPNGDGANDFLNIRGIEFRPGHRLRVFNRWGNEVFSSKDYKNDWAGDWHGNRLPAGTYFYILDLPGGDRRKGFLEIR